MACSNSCAHHWALAPSGSFLPGTPISQITCRQLESLNLTTLTIFAESSAMNPCQFKNYNLPYEAHTSSQPDTYYRNSSLESQESSKAWNTEYQFPTSYNDTLHSGWSCLDFECLQERLFYRNEDHGISPDATLKWFWEELKITSGSAHTGRHPVIKVYAIRLCESTFIQSLLLPNLRGTGGVWGAQLRTHSTNPPSMKRSRSSPELQLRDACSADNGN
jgi:hypothetical protein